MNCTSCAFGTASALGNCGVCSDPNCLLCRLSNPSRCTKCVIGTGFDRSQTCLPCLDTNCYNCNAYYTRCLSCNQNFGVALSNNTCLPCTNNHCVSCSRNSLNICYSCVTGYGLQFSTCQPCMFPCLTCTFSNFSLPVIWTQVCSLCQTGYVLDSNNQCQACNTGCYSCDANNSQSCITCLTGYFIQSTSCPLCISYIPNCL